MSFLTKRISSFSNKKTFKSGIIIHLCHDNIMAYTKRPEDVRITEYGKCFSSEDLCEVASTQLGLTWLVFPMVGVARKENDLFEWVGPDEMVVCKKDEVLHFYFRYRLLPSERGIKILKANKMPDFEYFVLQIREDFLMSRFSYKSEGSDTPVNNFVFCLN